MKSSIGPRRYNIPLNSPVHDVVTSNGSRSPVEDLAVEPPPCVEDGIVGSTGEGVLAVGRDTVDQDALLLEATCMLLDSVPIIPNPSHVCCRPQIAVGATEVGRIVIAHFPSHPLPARVSILRSRELTEVTPATEVPNDRDVLAFVLHYSSAPQQS